MIKENVEQFNIFKDNPEKRMYLFDSEGIKSGVDLTKMLLDIEKSIMEKLTKIDIVILIHNATCVRDTLLENDAIKILKKKHLFQVVFSKVEEFHFDQIVCLKNEFKEKFKLENEILLTSDLNNEKIPSKGIIICTECLSIDQKVSIDKKENYFCQDNKCSKYGIPFTPCKCEVDASTCAIYSKVKPTEITIECEKCDWKFETEKYDVDEKSIHESFINLIAGKLKNLNEKIEILSKEIESETDPAKKKELIKESNEISHEISNISNGLVIFSTTTNTKKLIFKTLISCAAILSASLTAAGVGAAPIPFADAVFLIPIQTTLVVTLSAIWNINVDFLPYKLLAGFLGLCVAELVGFTIAGAAKASLVLETPAMVIDSVVAGTITLSIGTIISVLYGVAWKICGDEPLTKETLLKALDSIPIKSIIKNVIKMRKGSNTNSLFDFTEATMQVVIDEIERDKEMENIKLINK
jgi:uncharacterized protein (DUF697 family)